MASLRTFAAIELDDALRRDLVRLRGRIDAGGSDVRWMSPEQCHLTLHFLGDVDERRLPELCAAMEQAVAQHEAFEMRLAGSGCFPPRGPVRIVWAGLDEPSGRLAGLHAGIESALAGLGFAREPRGFTPHVTIARVRSARQTGGLRAAVEAAAEFAGGTMFVEEIVLFQSLRSPQGAEYVALSRHTLRGTAP